MENFQLPGPCFRCRFSGDAALLEEWIGLNFVLREVITWRDLPEMYREQLRNRYGQRRRDVEITLGLRQPPLDREAAEAARRELTNLRTFTYSALNKWGQQGWLTSASAVKLRQECNKRIEQLEEQLADAPPEEPKPAYSYAEARRRQLLYQLQILDFLKEKGRLAGLIVYEEAQAAITADLHLVEITLGLRQPSPLPKPKPAPAPIVKTAKTPLVEPAETPSRKPPVTTKPVSPPPPPRRPLTWDRVWETLLSERTLRAILFLGATLLFAAAVSLVIWNWETFPPWLQVTFLASFTTLFYGLGWYVRTRMRLRVSGIALTGVASLLVPLDFYAFYLSGGFLDLPWRDFWLLTSAVCFCAYTLTVYLIQAEFFGYLVGLAAASFVASLLEFGGIERVWWPAAMADLSLVLALTAALLPEVRLKLLRRWRVLAAPFWHLAVLGTTAVLTLATGWQLTGLAGGSRFLTSMAISWWLGGGVYLLAVKQFQMRPVAVAAAVSFPIAALLTQQQLYTAWEISTAWYALGWALLTPIYLFVAHRLQLQAAMEGSQNDRDLIQAYGRIALVGCVLLILLSFGRALGDNGAMALVHTILALTMITAARLWQRPHYLAFSSLFLMSAMIGLVSTTGGALGHLGLGWALLAVGHIAAALRLSDRSQPRKADQSDNRLRYTVILFRAGWLIAALALLPPFFTLERSILTYALGNFIAINGWLALLVHEGRLPLPQFWPALRGRPLPLSPLTFQWTAALLLPLWLWLVWTNRRPAESATGLAFLALAWITLILGSRLRRLQWRYGRPWLTTAQISAVIAVLSPLFGFDQPVAALLFLSAALFYVVSTRILHNRWWLAAAGLSFPISLALGLDWLALPLDPLLFALSLVVLAYIAGPLLLHRYRGLSRRYQPPITDVAYFIGAILFLFSLIRVLLGDRTDALLLWTAATQAVLALSVGIYAWSENEEGFGHAAAWLGVISGGLLASAFSQGRGSSATKAALLAILYIAVERLLRQAALRRGWQWRPLAGQLWRLFRRPLLMAGWGVSFITIILALFRNLILLGGGPGRETWSIIGLLLITGLYLVSAWLFRRYPRMSGRRVWWSAVLIFFPWTLLTHMGWYLWGAPWPPSRYAISWAILALGLLGVATLLTAPAIDRRWTRPPKVVAHLLLPFALLWSLGNSATSSVTFGLAVIFYLLAVFSDRLAQLRWIYLSGLPRTSTPRSRFLYPAAVLVPVWGVYLLDYFSPGATRSTFGILLLSFSLPYLLLGRWVEWRPRAFTPPLYLVVLLTAVIGTFLVSQNQQILIGALLFNALLGLLTARFFAQPAWLFVTVAALPTAWLLTLDEWGVPPNRFGWGLLALSQVYLIIVWSLSRWNRSEKERLVQQLTANAVPFLVGVFGLLFIAVPMSSQDRLGIQIGYSAAVFLFVQLAVWLRQPILSAVAAALVTVPYWVTVSNMGLEPLNYGLALWPLITLYLLLGYALDKFVGSKSPISGESTDDPFGVLEPFPWNAPDKWADAAIGQLLYWWALPFYALALGGAALAVLLSLADPARLTITLLLAAVTFGWSTAYFRLRGWLLATIATLQLAVLSGFSWLDWWERPLTHIALLFLPVTFATAFIGMAVERRWNRQPAELRGPNWSSPFFVMLAADVALAQILSWNFGLIFLTDAEGIAITVGHTLLLAILAVWWSSSGLAAFTAILAFVGLLQYLFFSEAELTTWPTALALTAVAYGLVAYLLRYLRIREILWVQRPALKIWEQPLLTGGWSISGLSLLAAFAVGSNVMGLAFRAIFRLPLLTPNDIAQVQMVTAVLALLGLFYLAAAVVDRLPRLGYIAMGMLLTAWSLEWLLVWGQREVQWYAVPAGAYLLVVGYLEWHNGRRSLARWIDYLALLLLLGTSFWQSLGAVGWPYALLMGFEGLMITWWGSTRRLRRFLYAGVVGVTVDVVGQLIQPLLTATNRWIVFGIVGIFLVSLAILVERRLENVLALTKDVRRRLENWE
jgi:hypothetical protein